LLLNAMLRPYPADDMRCWPVSARVGNVSARNHDIEIAGVDCGNSRRSVGLTHDRITGFV
jgi:hypothetical protein